MSKMCSVGAPCTYIALGSGDCFYEGICQHQRPLEFEKIEEELVSVECNCEETLHNIYNNRAVSESWVCPAHGYKECGVKG